MGEGGNCFAVTKAEGLKLQHCHSINMEAVESKEMESYFMQ